MLAALLRFEKFESNLALGVLIRQLRGQDRDQVPAEPTIDAAGDLALVDGLIVVWAHVFVDQEKVVSIW